MLPPSYDCWKKSNEEVISNEWSWASLSTQICLFPKHCKWPKKKSDYIPLFDYSMNGSHIDQSQASFHHSFTELVLIGGFCQVRQSKGEKTHSTILFWTKILKTVTSNLLKPSSISISDKVSENTEQTNFTKNAKLICCLTSIYDMFWGFLFDLWVPLLSSLAPFWSFMCFAINMRTQVPLLCFFHPSAPFSKQLHYNFCK